jgi:hypothetical protein
MKRMVFLAIFALAVGPATAQPTTDWYNDRALHHQLDASVGAFFGSERGQFLELHGVPDPGANPHLVATQFRGVFDGVPQDLLTTKDGHVLYSACQPHNCAVAAAVLTKRDSAVVVAAALIHWRCGRRDLPPDQPARNPAGLSRVGACDDLNHPTVTMFFPSRAAVNVQQVRDLQDWARHWLTAVERSSAYRARYVTVALKSSGQ